MRIKKKASVSKYPEQKILSMTFTQFAKEDKQHRLPPIKRNIKNVSNKNILLKQDEKCEKKQKLRKQTETTLNESMMLQSFYSTKGKDWIKPSDYLKDIKELNLLPEEEIDLNQYEIKLTEKVEKNIQKIEKLYELTKKWTEILQKALSYVNSKKATTDKLIEEIKYWKVLSKKFDELEYEFNSNKTMSLLVLMRNCFKMKSEHNALLEKFIDLKEQVVQETPKIKKLYLSLEEAVAGLICQFQENQNICESITLLKQIMLAFQVIAQENVLLSSRVQIIYEKLQICMGQKLLAASIYPRELANISGLKQKYLIINEGLSFYSNFLSIVQEKHQQNTELIARIQYTRNIIVNLLQILSYFQFLYNTKEVLEFSKLFSYQIDFNIYLIENQEQWDLFMIKVNQSMQKRNFQP